MNESALWQNATGDGIEYWALSLMVLPVVTVFGNVLVCLSVYSDRNLHTVTNYFIVSLAIADILVGILVMPLAVYVEVNGSVWSLGDALCDAWVAFDVLCCTASILNLASISVDRYTAISQPLRYAKHKNSRRVYSMLALTWIVSVAISSPIVLGMNYTERRTSLRPKQCIFYNSDFIIFSSMGSFYIPCIVMLLLYCRMFRTIRQRARLSVMRRGSSRPENGGGGNRRNSAFAAPDSDPGRKDRNCCADGVIRYENRLLLLPQTPPRRLDTGVRVRVGGGGESESSPPVPVADDNGWKRVKLIDDGYPLCSKHDHSRDEGSESPGGAVELIPIRAGGGGETEGRDSAGGDETTPMTLLPPSECDETPDALLARSNFNDAHAEKRRPLCYLKSARLSVTRLNCYLRQRPSQQSRKDRSATRRERKATKTLAIVLAVFLFCWVPFFTINIINAICIRYDLFQLSAICHIPPSLFSLFVWLGYVNSCINPVIYTIFNVEFRRCFKRLLRLPSC